MKFVAATLILYIIHLWMSRDQIPAWSFTQFCVREQGQSIKDPWPDSKNVFTPYAEKSSPRLPANGRKYLLRLLFDTLTKLKNPNFV